MSSVLEAALLGLLTYVGTNLDNLAVLGALAAVGVKSRTLVVGSGAALLLLLVGAFAAGLAAGTLPVNSLRYLGFIPIALGVWALVRMIRSTIDDRPVPKQGSVFGVTMLMLANSADTLAVLAPLLAETFVHLRFVLCAGVGLGWVLWAATLLLGKRYFGRQKRLGRYCAPLAPLIMISAGVYVLLDTATDVV